VSHRPSWLRYFRSSRPGCSGRLLESPWLRKCGLRLEYMCLPAPADAPDRSQATDAMDLDEAAAHSKANHTPVSQAPDAPPQESEKRRRLPFEQGEASSGYYSYSPEDADAIAAAAGVPMEVAMETAVREESLAEEILNINAREDAACARRSSRAGAGSIELFAD